MIPEAMTSGFSPGPFFAFEVLYFASLIFLSVLGFHRYRLCWLYLKSRISRKTVAPVPDSHLPSVTVQIPVYNEVCVVKRIIEAACDMEYPRSLIEIQVLDDSTDQTSQIARGVIEDKSREGFKITHIRRGTRRGYKGGALRDAFDNARGEFTALFDADFIPPRDFLLRTVARFSDPRVGIVQARWGHLNLRQSLLTRLQGILLDGHFAVEQTGRSGCGLFLNFNGTASVIRKQCILSSGGWQEDTVAEDLDLSCRAQLNGWKIDYIEDLVCPAEIPSGIDAFKSQQSRWAEGGIQNAKKFLPEIFSRKDISAGFKTEAAFHMLGNFSSLLFLAVLFSAAVISIGGRSVPGNIYSSIGAVTFASGSGIFFFYVFAVLDSRSGGNVAGRLAIVPLAMALWAGMSVNTTNALIGSFAGRRGKFERTPKTASTEAKSLPVAIYGSRFRFAALVEMAISLILVFCAVKTNIPDSFLKGFLCVFAAAFFYVSLLSLKQGLGHFAAGS